MKINSVLRLDGRGMAYAFIEEEESFSDITSFSMQFTGNYEASELAPILRSIINIRNTNPFDYSIDGLNYFSTVTKTCGHLEFNYLGNGTTTIIINKCRVLFCGETNVLTDLCEKLEELAE